MLTLGCFVTLTPPELGVSSKLQDKILMLQVYCIFIEFRPLGDIRFFFFNFLWKYNLHSEKRTYPQCTLDKFLRAESTRGGAPRSGHGTSPAPKEPPPLPPAAVHAVSQAPLPPGSFPDITLAASPISEAYINGIKHMSSFGSGLFCSTVRR